MISPVRAVRTAVTWLTVLPLGRAEDATQKPDRALGGAVIAAVPVVGAVLGLAVAGLAVWLAHTGLPDLLVGVLLVAATAALTRGMHLDGLADTADGLGCYGPPERVAEVMRSGTVGPFGVGTLVLTMSVQAVGFAAFVHQSRWYELFFAVVVGRLGAVVGARWSLPAAHPDGFGALVAGTQRWSIAVWGLVVLAAAIPTGAGRDGFGTVGAAIDLAAVLQSMAVVVAVGVFAWAFTRHCGRRMGGLTGDVLGATIELGVALAVVGLLL